MHSNKDEGWFDTFGKYGNFLDQPDVRIHTLCYEIIFKKRNFFY